MKLGSVLCSIGLVMVCLFFGSLAGCTYKAYYKYFESENLPGVKKEESREFIFEDFTIFLVSYAGYRREPILDSAFKIIVWADPTDTTKDGNDRFVRSFLVNSMIITDSVTGDTLATSTDENYELADRGSRNRKRYDYGMIDIPEHVRRIILTIDVQFEDANGIIRTQDIAIPLLKHEGFKRELKSFTPGGKWD